MEALATAIVQTFRFLELVDDDTLDPDAAVNVMEMLSATLQAASTSERTALKQAVENELQAARKAKEGSEVLKFYEGFLANLGLESVN